MLENACQEQGYQLYMPPLNLCGDNAAMIGSQAYYEYLGRADCRTVPQRDGQHAH